MASTNELIQAINKSSKKVIGAVNLNIPDPPRLPSDFFALDLACGGGFPQGRAILVYGLEASLKTSLGLKLIAMSQKLYPEKRCLFIDVEGRLAQKWAETFGVNWSELLYIRPDSADQVVDIMEGMVMADDIGVIVLDSIAAMVTHAEMDKTADQANVGTQGLMVNKMYRKLTHSFNESARIGNTPTVVFINQIRYKIGVMFGNPECLHGSTLVNFVDGRSIPIRDVVKKKIFAPVWSYNEETGKFVLANILSHHYNGRAKDGEFLTVTSKAVDTKNGVLSATVSITHKFLTSKGWKQAADLVPGDQLVSRTKDRLNGSLRQFLLGTACGDLHLAVLQNGKGATASMKIEDSQNEGYADWKVGVLSDHFQFHKSPNDSKGFRYTSNPRSDLARFKEKIGRRNPEVFFQEFSWLGFSVWLMDDATYFRDRYTLSIGRAKNDLELRERVSFYFDQYSLTHSWSENKNVVFRKEVSDRIAKNIAEFVPSCMQRKLPQYLKAGGDSLKLVSDESIEPALVEVVSVVPSAAKKYRARGYYDLQIEGTHNYMVGNLDNGFVVHNTMPGGPAINQFMSSLTLRVRGEDIYLKKTDKLPTYKKIHVTVKKWSVPILSKNCEYMIALRPVPEMNLKTGESYSWNTVLIYLKKLELLTKVDDGWQLSKKVAGINYVFGTQDELKEKYQLDNDFGMKVRKAVIDTALVQGDPIDETEESDG